MYGLLIGIHILSAFTLVTAVLLQSGKGAEIGAAFGGSSQTLFGSRGAATFLSKVTAVTATVFLLTALALAVMSKERSIASSIVDLPQTEAVEESVPATPSQDSEASSLPTPAESGAPEGPADAAPAESASEPAGGSSGP